MKRITLSIYCKGKEINSDTRDLTDEEYNDLVKEIGEAQSGKIESLTVTNNSYKYFVPRKQLMRSVITIHHYEINGK